MTLAILLYVVTAYNNGSFLASEHDKRSPCGTERLQLEPKSFSWLTDCIYFPCKVMMCFGDNQNVFS